MRNYYREIDAALDRLENFKYATHDIDWCCDRIAWCWKFRHISNEQKDELCDRAIHVLDLYRYC